MLLFTCYSRSAREARALGLVDHMVPLAELEKCKRDITRQLRRARSETVAMARNRNKAAFAEALKQGVADTNAALGGGTGHRRLAHHRRGRPWIL
jgi:enoyl-CoA hydratase/carnithine racemase